MFELLLKELMADLADVEARGGWFATDPAVTSNPNDKANAPVAVLA